METILVFVILMWIPSIIILFLGVTETIRESRYEKKLKRMMGARDAD